MSRTGREWDDAALDRTIGATLNVNPSADFVARVRDAVAGVTIDQEIQPALNIDPSPDFLARVRSATAAPPVGVQRMGVWPVRTSAALAVAAVILLAVWLARTPQGGPAAPSTPSGAASGASLASAQPTMPAAAPAIAEPDPPRTTPPATPSNVRAARVRRSEPGGNELPPVVVSARDANAYYDYIASLDGPALHQMPIAALDPVAPIRVDEVIAVDHIEINPIEPPSQ